MVQGMKFLSKKSFNPHNNTNRKQVYEAQQEKKLEDDRIRQRHQQLQKEKEDEELLSLRTGDGSQAQLRFMYDAPPGMNSTNNKKRQVGEQSEAHTKQPRIKSEADMTQAQPGDDAAAAAFRQMLASVSKQSTDADPLDSNHQTVEGDDGQKKLGFAPVLQGSSQEVDLNTSHEHDVRSALEKAVGRKDRSAALTLEEQLIRFPQLKDAPMAKGMSVTDVNVSFKPLGSQLRNVKCLSCGVWGHSRGDRECKKTGWNPFESSFASNIAASVSSNHANSLRPNAAETRKLAARKASRDTKTQDTKEKGSTDSDLDSGSSSSSREATRRRKRKHKSKHKSSSRDSSRRRRRNRSESPSRKSSKRRKKSSSRKDHR